MKRNKYLSRKYLELHPSCANCGKKAIQVHHIIPLILGGNDIESNLVSLCDECHEKLHNIHYENKGLNHSELTKIGLQKAKEQGKKLGNRKGIKIETKKAINAKKQIIELNYSFNGSLNNEETCKIIRYQ